MIGQLRFALCFIICFIIASPIFGVLGIKGSILLLVLSILTVVVNWTTLLSSKWLSIYKLGMLYMFTVSLSAIYNESITPLIFAGFFVLAFFTIIQTSNKDAVLLVKIATYTFLLLILFSIFGAIYYYAGGNPLLVITNPDGRDNFLYLTTFSNAAEFFIRPSAIYDEPGTFSFYICFIVAFRSLLGMPKRISGLLLLGGLITLSISHVIFMVVWVVWITVEDGWFRVSIKKILVLALFLFLGVIIYQAGLLDWTLGRALEYYKDPLINPRYLAFEKILIDIANSLQGFWFGFDVDCIGRTDNCAGIGENPLTPLVYGGILVAWPYYVFLLIAFVAPFFSSRGLILLGIGLLLLQRPYLLEFPCSALMGLLLLVATTGQFSTGQSAQIAVNDLSVRGN